MRQATAMEPRQATVKALREVDDLRIIAEGNLHHSQGFHFHIKGLARCAMELLDQKVWTRNQMMQLLETIERLAKEGSELS